MMCDGGIYLIGGRRVTREEFLSRLREKYGPDPFNVGDLVRQVGSFAEPMTVTMIDRTNHTAKAVPVSLFDSTNSSKWTAGPAYTWAELEKVDGWLPS